MGARVSAPAANVASGVLGLEPRHIENVAECDQTMPARYGGKIGAEFGHISRCCLPILGVSHLVCA